MRRVLIAGVSQMLLAPLTMSCSPADLLVTCPEGSSISDRALLEAAVEKLVQQSQSPGHPEWVRYESVADFIERNLDCCFVTKPDGYAGQPISLPIAFGEEMELVIRYRRLNDGDAPFAIRYVSVGPCPSHMEESERYLTAAQYEASNDWRWTWRVSNQDAIAPDRT